MKDEERPERKITRRDLPSMQGDDFEEDEVTDTALRIGDAAVPRPPSAKRAAMAARQPTDGPSRVERQRRIPYSPAIEPAEP